MLKQISDDIRQLLRRALIKVFQMLLKLLGHELAVSILETIVELKRQGMTQKQIGERLGVSQQAIGKRLTIMQTEYPELYNQI